MLLIQESLKSLWWVVHIVANTQIQKKYTSIAKELSVPYEELTSLHDISILTSWVQRVYSLHIDLLEQEISESLHASKLEIKKWSEIDTQKLMKDLHAFGYEFHEYQKPGSYIRSWDSLHIYYPEWGYVTLSFWWDEVESIHDSDGEIHENLSLSSICEFYPEEKNNISLKEILENNATTCIIDSLQFHHLYEKILSWRLKWISLNLLSSIDDSQSSISLWIQNLTIQNLEDLKSTLWDKENRCRIFSRHIKTIQEFLDANNFWHIQTIKVATHLLTSFSYTEKKQNHVYICDDILWKIFIKKRVKKKLSAEIDLLLKIQNGDYIVHIDHGIWVFDWIIKKQIGNIEKEYLEISYKQNDKLYVPITQVHRVSKYIGSENPSLTPLSWKVWEKKMQKIHEDIREIAEWILKNFAERKLRKSSPHKIHSSKLEAFQSWFPYSYTPDQSSAIVDILSDMQSDKNMDRLLVWDVGFWKTEVAFNAAFAALENKKQVLLISPLVVLAHEHYDKTLERFLELGFNIEVLTRLQSQKHATKVLKGLSDGNIDMVVGTHRLLSEKLSCKRLGLMIVDEEHKFWVADKEKIKNIKSDIDILSLSATPIPRSLNLALSWVRDISLLKTPPMWRKSIETSVLRFNQTLIQDAGKREFARGGQIFFVHNRVATIEVIRKKLESLFPKRRVIITHGQLPWEELENRILDFKNKKYDILLSTTVIENGIDFSNVNTIFINECQQFWISQIHQLRWRVGRSNLQWYCYLLYKREHLDGEAAKRIQTIVDYSYLWAGFELAMKDLEIRWWWDILWVRQSGQAKEIWVSLFLKMLEEKITELKLNTDANEWEISKKELHVDTKIDLMIWAGIPDSYFLSETDKINFYRELEMIQDQDDLQFLKESFFENNSEDIPDETHRLFELLECQIYCQKYMIQSIKKIGVNYSIIFDKRADIEVLKSFLLLDREVKFIVASGHQLRTPAKVFANDGLFIEYLLRLFTGRVWNPKIKLAKKMI